MALVGAAKSDRVDRDRERHHREKDSYYDPLYKRARLCRRIFLCVLVALIFTGIVFVLDVAGVVLTKDTIHDKSKGIAKLEFGPAVSIFHGCHPILRWETISSDNPFDSFGS